jgi:hypothetical protein
VQPFSSALPTRRTIAVNLTMIHYTPAWFIRSHVAAGLTKS